MKKFLKRSLVVLIVLLVIVQIVPRNNSNNGSLDTATSIDAVHQVPENVSLILKTSCYDCHSDHTTYPWYSNIQPISWWLSDHVEEGKRELNFSAFGTYSVRRQFHKLKEIAEQVEEQEMPLSSYTLIHRNAILNKEQSDALVKWTKALRDSFQMVYPADSLERRKR